MQITKLIGITGFARSGKDTLGTYLSERSGIDTYALASPIKRIVNTLFGWDERHSDGDLKESDVIARLTKDSVIQTILLMDSYLGDFLDNKADSIRELLDVLDSNSGGLISPRKAYQLLGTEGGRSIDSQIWLKVMQQELIRNGSLIVTDVRFDNEAQWVRDNGGTVIKVEREDARPVNFHSSENGVDDDLCDILLSNDGNIDEFLDLAGFVTFDTENPILKEKEAN
jgi:hypothetical protein